MEIRNLRTFLTIVEQGSYQKAADMLSYTQSTVSSQMQQLERDLGRPLFERMGRRMILTQYGKAILEKSRQLLQLSDEIISMKTDEIGGMLRIDIAEIVLYYLMQPVLREFHTRAPQVKLALRHPNYLQIEENIRNGSSDLGIACSIDWNYHPFIVEELGIAQMALLAAPEFPIYDFDTPNQTLAATFITDKPDSIFRNGIEEYFHQKEIRPNHIMELGSTATLKSCVMANLGFTYLPRFIAKKELENGTLKEIPFALTNTPSHVLCIRHKNHFLSPAMTLFIEILHKHLLKNGTIQIL